MGSANVNLRIARNLSSTGWEKFKDYRDKKSQEAFDFLESAAKTVDKTAEKHFPEARKEAGKLTKAAHARLDKSLESLQGTGRELADGNVSETVENVREAASENFSKATKKAQKQAKKLRKKADKKLGRKNRKRLSRAEKKANAAAQKVKDKAAKKLNKKTKSQSKSRGFGFYALWAAVLAAVVGVVAYVLNKRNSGAQEQPPHVSDYSSNTTSTLVYSSTSEDDLEAPNADASEENKKAEKKPASWPRIQPSVTRNCWQTSTNSWPRTSRKVLQKTWLLPKPPALWLTTMPTLPKKQRRSTNS